MLKKTQKKPLLSKNGIGKEFCELCLLAILIYIKRS